MKHCLEQTSTELFCRVCHLLHLATVSSFLGSGSRGVHASVRLALFYSGSRVVTERLLHTVQKSGWRRWLGPVSCPPSHHPRVAQPNLLCESDTTLTLVRVFTMACDDRYSKCDSQYRQEMDELLAAGGSERGGGTVTSLSTFTDTTTAPTTANGDSYTLTSCLCL